MMSLLTCLWDVPRVVDKIDQQSRRLAIPICVEPHINHVHSQFSM